MTSGVNEKDGADSSEAGSEDEGNHGSNPGWADAMARVLRSKKPKKSRSIVLSRAKKLNEVTKKIETSVAEEDVKPSVADVNSLLTRRKRQEVHSKCRLKPSVLDRERERRLNRIATKGVVQLFNAVRQQQKTIESRLKEAGESEVKRDKVMKSLDKRAFLDVLMGTSRSEPVDSPVKEEIKEEEDDPQTWQVLRDDFMMGTARLKDWDKT